MPPSNRARSTLAAALRAYDDAALAALLRERPELAQPVVPADLGALALRASTRTSVQAALDSLDAGALQVLDALLVAGDGARADDLAGLLGLPTARPSETEESGEVGASGEPREGRGDRAVLVCALARLVRLALAWRERPDGGIETGPATADTRYVLVRTLHDIVGPHPSGLGPPLATALRTTPRHRLRTIATTLGLPSDASSEAVASAMTEPGRIPALIAEAEGVTSAAGDVLGSMAWQSPRGSVHDGLRPIEPGAETTVIEVLLTRGLLVATDPTTAALPREVGLTLRGGRIHPEPALAPPAIECDPRESELVTRTAAGAAVAVVGQVSTLLESWGDVPPPTLRTGGLSVRDTKAAMTLLGLDEAKVAFVADLAFAAGLCSQSLDPVRHDRELWMPTRAYDAWTSRPTAERWATLAEAWLDSRRLSGLVGSRDDHDKRFSTLDPDLVRWEVPRLRAAVLSVLAEVGDGVAATTASIEAAVRHRVPRLGVDVRDDHVGWTLAETAHLGVTGLGALSPFGRRLLDRPGTPILSAALAPFVPEPVDYVLIQADLTAVAPGPLEPAAAAELGLAADVESTGGATVFRFTAESVRRALDHGRTAEELHTMLAQHSRTPVPQPLTYLVDDVARRHGRIRVAAASTVIHADDPSILDALQSDRTLAKLHLRRLAPTVLVSDDEPNDVLAAARGAGHAPLRESPSGDVVVSQKARYRARQRSLAAYGRATSPPLSAEEAVRMLRQGEMVSRARPDRSNRAHAYDTVGPPRRGRDADASYSLLEITAVLDGAIEHGAAVWLTHVADDGMVYERLLMPQVLADGWCTGFEVGSNRARSIPVHRITAVAQADLPA